MNIAQFLSLLRTILQIIGTGLVSHGTLGINGAMWEQISGAVVMIAAIIWSQFAHTDTAQLKAVEAMPDVKKIVAVTNAGDGVGTALADPARPKVVTA